MTITSVQIEAIVDYFECWNALVGYTCNIVLPFLMLRKFNVFSR